MDFLCCTNYTLFVRFQPFLDAMNTRDPRVRVLPQFNVVESMLGTDGTFMVEPHATSYATFLAGQIADLIAYFESRQHRSRGEVSLEERPTLNATQLGSPPLLNWGTPNTSGVSWTNNSTHSTPMRNGVEKPMSGVKIAKRIFGNNYNESFYSLALLHGLSRSSQIA